MTEIPKERREEFRLELSEGAPGMSEISLFPHELRSLLNTADERDELRHDVDRHVRIASEIADERDRYRALLDKILTVQSENYGDAMMTHILLYQPCEEARAALGGNDGN